MRNVSENSCRKNKKKICTVIFFENGVAYEIMWKNSVQPEKWRQQERLHDVMSQKKTNFNFLFIYLMLYIFRAVFFHPLV